MAGSSPSPLAPPWEPHQSGKGASVAAKLAGQRATHRLGRPALLPRRGHCLQSSARLPGRLLQTHTWDRPRGEQLRRSDLAPSGE